MKKHYKMIIISFLLLLALGLSVSSFITSFLDSPLGEVSKEEISYNNPENPFFSHFSVKDSSIKIEPSSADSYSDSQEEKRKNTKDETYRSVRTNPKSKKERRRSMMLKELEEILGVGYPYHRMTPSMPLEKLENFLKAAKRCKARSLRSAKKQDNYLPSSPNPSDVTDPFEEWRKKWEQNPESAIEDIKKFGVYTNAALQFLSNYRGPNDSFERGYRLPELRNRVLDTLDPMYWGHSDHLYLLNLFHDNHIPITQKEKDLLIEKKRIQPDEIVEAIKRISEDKTGDACLQEIAKLKDTEVFWTALLVLRQSFLYRIGELRTIVDSIPPFQVLFNGDTSLKKELDERKLPKEILESFRSQNIALSKNAIVKVRVCYRYWWILDQKKKWHAEVVEGKLIVYPDQLYDSDLHRELLWHLVLYGEPTTPKEQKLLRSNLPSETDIKDYTEKKEWAIQEYREKGR